MFKSLLTATLLLFGSFLSAGPYTELYSTADYSTWDLALTTGYVWKTDKIYKPLYGKGIHNIATLDLSHFPLKNYGVGVQAAFWQAEATTCGCENLISKDEEGYFIRTHNKWKKDLRMQQIPVLAYLKARIGSIVQAYAAVGGGVVVATEKSNEKRSKKVAPAFSAEVGVKYSFCRGAFATVALHWINAHKSLNGYPKRLDFGGISLKFGLGASF